MDKNNLDLLLMLDNNLDTVGGEQESTKIIISGLKNQLSIGVIQPGNAPKLISKAEFYDITECIRLKHLIKNPVAFIRYIHKVKDIINSKKPSIIHTQAQVSFFIVAFLRKLRLISKEIYLIHTERGLYTKYSFIIKHIFYFCMKEANMFILTTEFNMNHWSKSLENKSHSLEFKIIENTAGKLFETYNNIYEKKDSDKIMVGFSGRYTNWKNWPLAEEISLKLNSIIGEKLQIKMAVGCLDDKSMRNTKNMFERLNITFENRFEGKINIKLQEMDIFYYDIDVFVLTSKYNTESFGRTLVEAMSRKTVVLTTNAGGSVEVVGNSDNVLDSADDFVKRIVELFKNKEKMDQEKQKNLIRVKQCYSLSNNINKHLELYNKILKQKSDNESK